jgi:hypothetical protein
MHRAITRILVPATFAVGVLSGCAVQDPAYPPTTGAVLGGSGPRTVEYPGGKYQLYGDGSTASPYYWVWIPAGTNPPAPPPLPSTRVATAATEGRYQLYGDGSTSSPYYWVWVPAGTTVVPPPPPPRRP